MLFECFIVSFFIIFILIKLSPLLKLIDYPNQRKRHSINVPIVGGLSIFISFFICLIFQNNFYNYTSFFLLSSIVLVVGVLDDRFDINYKVRLFIEVLVVFILTFIFHLKLKYLGDMFGLGNIVLSLMLYLTLTVLGVLGAINAFNMIDGIDGLLGCVSLISLGSLAYLFKLSGEIDLYHFCLSLSICVIPFLILNLGFLGSRFKVFMGDAGSIFFGFTIIWLILNGSQDPEKMSFHPVTALWIIAIPLLDMVSVMLRRIRKGKSPFFADRTHLHHICQRVGLSKTSTLIFIVSLAIIFALIGILGEVKHIPSYWMFYSFILLFLIYNEILKRIWRITAYFRRRRMNLLHSH